MENVWRFRLKGQGAYTFPTVNIGHHLLKEKIIPSLTIWEEAAYYQLGNPAERYVAFSPDTDVHFRHGTEIQAEFVTGQKAFIRIEDVSIRDCRIIVTNVAPTTSSTWMEQMLTEAELNPTQLQNNKKRRDMWQFYTDVPIDQIPHYLEVEGALCQTLQIQVPGRLIECFHCRKTDHWTSACPKEKQLRTEEWEARVKAREEKELRKKKKEEEESMEKLKKRIERKYGTCERDKEMPESKEKEIESRVVQSEEMENNAEEEESMRAETGSEAEIQNELQIVTDLEEDSEDCITEGETRGHEEKKKPKSKKSKKKPKNTKKPKENIPMENKDGNVMKEVARQIENIEIEGGRKRDRERASSEEIDEEIEKKISRGMVEYSGPDQNTSPPHVDDCKPENVTNFNLATQNLGNIEIDQPPETEEIVTVEESSSDRDSTSEYY